MDSVSQTKFAQMNATTDRISSALAKLRTEMVSTSIILHINEHMVIHKVNYNLFCFLNLANIR